MPQWSAALPILYGPDSPRWRHNRRGGPLMGKEATRKKRRIATLEGRAPADQWQIAKPLRR